MQATATQSPAAAPETAATPEWMNYSGPGEPKGVLWRDRYGTITLSSLPFALLMLSGLFVFTTHFSWLGLGVCLISWAVRQWAITGVYHRYFSHKSYKVGRVTQFLLALLGTTAAQKRTALVGRSPSPSSRLQRYRKRPALSEARLLAFALVLVLVSRNHRSGLQKDRRLREISGAALAG